MSVEVCIARTSAAIVQQVPREARQWYIDWQRGVSTAAEAFSGYQGTDVYPPADPDGTEWVATIHFDDDAALQTWLNSAEREKWVAKLRAEIGDFEVKTLTGGFSQWFRGVNSAENLPTPSWKMAATVLLGLYPTVMLLNLFVGPFTTWMGLAFAMLIGNALSVASLQWIVMPLLTKGVSPWLTANSPRQNLLSYGGLVLLIVVLCILATIFRLQTG